MYDQAVNCTKLRHLAVRLREALGITEGLMTVATGILERLWAITSEQRPRGDIGSLSDEVLAIQLDYPVERIPAILEALAATRWLDPAEGPERYRVHDWAQHCKDHVHRKLAKETLTFADGKAPNLKAVYGRDRDAVAAKFAKAGVAIETPPSAPKPRRARGKTTPGTDGFKPAMGAH